MQVKSEFALNFVTDTTSLYRIGTLIRGISVTLWYNVID